MNTTYKIAFLLIFASLLIDRSQEALICYPINPIQSMKQIYQLPYNYRLGSDPVPSQYNFALQFDQLSPDLLYTLSSIAYLKRYLITSNNQVISIIPNSIGDSLNYIPLELTQYTFSIVAIFSSLSSFSDNQDFLTSYCSITQFPQTDLTIFRQINKQNQQFLISTMLISQIQDLNSLVLSYPTSFAIKSQNAANLGCQLYTDYGIINDCSVSLNAQSGLSFVTFNLTNFNFSLLNVSATIVLNYSTFNQNSLSNKQFSLQLLNQYQSQIAQYSSFQIIDQRICQQTTFSASLINNVPSFGQNLKLKINFVPASANITRIIFEFSSQIYTKIDLSFPYLTILDSTQTNQQKVRCLKAYQFMLVCDLIGGNLLFDVTKGVNIEFPYVQLNVTSYSQTLSFQIKYFTDLTFQTCFVSNFTQKFQAVSPSSPQAFLYSNNSLQIRLFDLIMLDNSSLINISLPSQLAFTSTSKLSQIAGISNLSQTQQKTQQNIQISQIGLSLAQLKTYQGISFQLTNIIQNTIYCSLSSLNQIQIEIVNSLGVIVLSGSIPLQNEPYPIQIQQINPIFTPLNQQQQLQYQQQQNSYSIPFVTLEINFQIQINYFPQSSAFVIYLPPQIIRDNRVNNISVEISNQFNFYCSSQTNSTQFFSSNVTYQNSIQQRDSISILCQFSENITTNNPQYLFTARIQGYLLPKQVQKPTDRIIINLLDYSQKQYQPQYQCLSTESSSTSEQIKSQWVFNNNQGTDLLQTYYSTLSISNQNQSIPYSFVNLTTRYPIQDGDTIIIRFSKLQFFKNEVINGNQQQLIAFPELKNLNCSFLQPQSNLSTFPNLFSICNLSESSTWYSINLQLYPTQLASNLSWNYKDLALSLVGLQFYPNQLDQNQTVQFQHISSDNFLISQSNYNFTIKNNIASNALFALNKIKSGQFQSLDQQASKLLFDYIQLQFQSSIFLLPSIQNITLTLQFSQEIQLSDDSFCSIDIGCSQRTLILKCNLSLDGLYIQIDQLGQYSTCTSSVLNNFNITIHNPEINNSNSTGGAQSIAINWNLTSTTTSQTLLSGHTSLTTNTSQCPQPHCATCSSLPSICLHCTQGYYLLPDQTSCVQTCPPPTVPHQQTPTCQPCFQQQECLQCQSQNPAACTSCSPNYSLNSTLLPYCYVPLPPSSSGPSSSSTSSSPSSSPSSPSSSSSSSSSVTKDVVNRTSSNSTFSGELNRLERGGQQQQQSQKQQEAQASDEGGFASFLAQTKSYTKGLILTLLIPLSILGACLTRLVTFCLKKREKKVHAQPSESRSAQIAQNLDERQETQKDGNGGDEEQMRASSRVDTGNMCPLNSRRGEQLQLGSVEQQSDGAGGGEREGNGHLAFCWVAVILLLGNLGDLVEVPYIMFSQQSSFSKKSTSVFELQFWEADMGQICCLSYIALNGICYLICVVLMVKAIIFESGSGEPLFSIYEVRLSSRSSFCSVGGEEMKKDKSEVEWKGDSNRQNENKEKHKKGVSGRKLWKLTIDVLLRCLVVVGGKAFCMVYSNVANVKGWLTCQVNKNLRAFRLFYMILCIHAIFNMISAAFFTFVLTHFSFVSWAAVVGQDSLTSQGIDGRVEFSFFVDILAFKFLMSLICFLNCMHIQQLIAACKSSNLPGHQHSTSHPVQSPSTPSSSPSPAGAVARGVGKASYFENTPNAEKTTPTTVTLASYRQQDASGTGSQNLIEGRPRRKKPSKLSLLLKGDSGQKPGGSSSSRQQETPSPNLPSYSPNLYPSQAYI
uniref:MTBp n=1 Tax=Tetrahymena malaccensis TaxID=5901 RepID=A0A513X5A9_TETMA|nr:MTBp [Tetrahymena malaccensis]